jgi:hypothetical protein
MGCVLRVFGEHLDIDALFQSQKLTPVVTWRKGQERILRGRFHMDSGANFDVSNVEDEDFSLQISDAEVYLTENSDEIIKLASASGVEEATLDFSVSTRPGFLTQTSFFPPTFLQQVARLGLGLAVSHYPTDDSVE